MLRLSLLYEFYCYSFVVVVEYIRHNAVSVFGIQGVTCRTNGTDDVPCALGVDRLAQSPDVDVDGARLDHALPAPDGVEQAFAREDPSRMFEEVAQDLEFGRPQP